LFIIIISSSLAIYMHYKDFNSYLMQGVDLLTAWYSKIEENNFRVLAIEEAFNFNLPNITMPIIGATDLVEEDDAGTVIITDFKTAGRAYGRDEVDNNIQREKLHALKVK